MIPDYLYVVYKAKAHNNVCAVPSRFSALHSGKALCRLYQMRSADNQPHPLCFDLVQEVCLIPLQLLQIPTCHLKAQSPVFFVTNLDIFYLKVHYFVFVSTKAHLSVA